MVSINRNEYDIRIYINNILHLQVIFKDHDGIQSWLEGTKKVTYFIEYYRKNNEPIITQYDSKELWLEILKQLDNNL
jgi:hypothetical protein